MQSDDLERHSDSEPTRSDSSSFDDTNGDTFSPNTETFTFRVFRNLPCEEKEDRFSWKSEDAIPLAEGKAWEGDPGKFLYRWNSPSRYHKNGQAENNHCSHGYFPYSKLRKQTTADGSQSRYIQTYGLKKTERPDQTEYASQAPLALVGSWTGKPLTSSTKNSSSAEKDSSPDISTEAEEGSMWVDRNNDRNTHRDGLDIPDDHWVTSHQTGDMANVWDKMRLSGPLCNPYRIEGST